MYLFIFQALLIILFAKNNYFIDSAFLRFYFFTVLPFTFCYFTILPFYLSEPLRTYHRSMHLVYKYGIFVYINQQYYGN